MSGDTYANISNLVKIYWTNAVGSGRLSLNGQQGSYSKGSEGDTPHNGFNINLSHTHNYDHKHDITADGGTEARPDNYTIRVWKRTA
jgi:hypothetical protein